MLAAMGVLTHGNVRRLPRPGTPPRPRSTALRSRVLPGVVAETPRAEVGTRVSELTEVDLELDCRGMRCPMPVIELARHLADVEVGGTIGVVADDVAARVDVPAWCRMRGQEYVGEEVAADGVPRYLVRRLS